MCLFSSKIGYSLSSTPSVLCNVLKMDDISEAVIEDPGGVDGNSECSFIVKVLIVDPLNKASAEQELEGTGEQSEVDCMDHFKRPVYSQDLSSFKKHALLDQGIASPLLPQPYYFRARSVSERDHWITDINTALRLYRDKKDKHASQTRSFLRRNQQKLRAVYDSVAFQTGTAMLVGLNFFFTVPARSPV